MASRTKMLFSLGMILLMLSVSLGQRMTFPKGIRSQGQDGETFGNWTADGKLTLTRVDGTVFEPKVDVQLVTKLCAIDLRSCVPKQQIPMTSEEPCYCTKDSEEEYSLHVTGQGHTSQNDVTVQAITPARYTFSPLALAAHVGDLPDFDDNKTGPQKTPTTTVETRSNKPDTCADVQGSSPRQVAVLSSGLEVVCDTETDNGGWVVIQRRETKYFQTDREWEEYKYGFGDIHGDFWFGLEKVHRLTFQRRYELRIDLVIEGKKQFAHYRNFTLLGEHENYRIRVGGYSGTATDDLGRHDKSPFSTSDRDHDSLTTKNCAAMQQAGWWYTGCFGDSRGRRSGFTWWATTAYFVGMDITLTEMKIRPLES